MITIIYQFKHNVKWHCRINQFFSFPEQLQIWIYVFLVGDHRYANKTGADINISIRNELQKIFKWLDINKLRLKIASFKF